MGNWYSFCTQIMTEVEQLSLKSSTAEGRLLKSNNLVGDKPLRPGWQSHLSCPYQCKTEWTLAWRFLVIVTTYTGSPEKPQDGTT